MFVPAQGAFSVDFLDLYNTVKSHKWTPEPDPKLRKADADWSFPRWSGIRVAWLRCLVRRKQRTDDTER